MIFLKDFFEKVDFEINLQHEKFSGGGRVNTICSIFSYRSQSKYTGGAELYVHAFLRTHKFDPDFFCGSFIYLCPSLTYCLVCVLQHCGHLLGKC